MLLFFCELSNLALSFWPIPSYSDTGTILPYILQTIPRNCASASSPLPLSHTYTCFQEYLLFQYLTLYFVFLSIVADNC